MSEPMEFEIVESASRPYWNGRGQTHAIGTAAAGVALCGVFVHDPLMVNSGDLRTALDSTTCRNCLRSLRRMAS